MSYLRCFSPRSLQVVGFAVNRLLYKLCVLLGLDAVLSHITPALRPEAGESSTFLVRGATVCVAAVLSQPKIQFDPKPLMNDLAPLLESQRADVRRAAFEFFAVLQVSGNKLRRTSHVAVSRSGYLQSSNARLTWSLAKSQ